MAHAARAVALAAGLLCLLSACQDEPDFDERYQAAEKKVREKAAELDADIAKADRERATERAKGEGQQQAPGGQPPSANRLLGGNQR